ncbi:MAG: hypothetical protein AB7G13_24350 [Lautropia sp.]
MIKTARIVVAILGSLCAVWGGLNVLGAFSAEPELFHAQIYLALVAAFLCLVFLATFRYLGEAPSSRLNAAGAWITPVMLISHGVYIAYLMVTMGGPDGPLDGFLVLGIVSLVCGWITAKGMLERRRAMRACGGTGEG